MRLIKLTQGKLALVDDEDLAELSKHKWFAKWTGTGWEVMRQKSWNPGRRRSAYITMATQLMGVRKGFLPDHRDRDPFNHQRSNLRWATFAQNCVNRARVNKHGHRGVARAGGKFLAQMVVAGKHRYLGIFQTAKEAGAAYNRAAEQQWGEFAVLNPL